jgi:hypothetical protein
VGKLPTRKPKSSSGKSAPADAPIAGGRAWARAQQFAIARGLPMAIDPGKGESRKPGKRAGATRVSGAAEPASEASTTVRRRKKI